MDRRSSSRSAPYGHACLNCFKSKCRCVSRADGHGCERCHHLNKQCQPQDLHNRDFRKRQSSNGRIAQLEGRLDSLVSLLQSVVSSPESSAALRKVFEEKGIASHGPLQQQNTTPTSGTIAESTIANNDDDDGAVQNSTASPTPAPNDLGMDCEPTSDEAEGYLAIFRSQMLPYFAFIHIPPSLTAQQLHQDRPFLFRAIIAVTSSSVSEKVARGKELKRVLAQTTLFENQSSIDLLLGLLTYIAWSFDHTVNKSGTLSRLMLLAMSLVYDLRLNKPLPPDVHMIGAVFPGLRDYERVDTQQHLLERQRAVLGCFLLSSTVSSYFAQIDAMRWTPRMEECLRAISASHECSTDEAFACQVRLQLLGQKVIQIQEQREMDYAQAPVFHYLRTLRVQLQELRGSLSPGLRHHQILQTHMEYISLCINEMAYTTNPEESPLMTPAASSRSSMLSCERLECLWRSVSAIRAWLDIFFTLSPSACVGFSFIFSSQLSRSLVILYRLSTYIDPAWDRRSVRDTVDLVLVLDRLTDKLDLISKEAGEQSHDGLYMGMARMLRAFRAFVATKIVPEEAEEVEATSLYGGSSAGGISAGSINAGGISAGGDNMVDHDELMQSIDFGNNMWLEQAFGQY